MNRFLRDVRLQFSTTSVVLAVLLLATGGATVAAFLSSQPNGSNLGSGVALTVTYTTEYEFAAYAYNSSGMPIAGADITITFWAANSSSPPLEVASGSTASNGTTTIRIALPDRNYSVEFDGPGLTNYGAFRTLPVDRIEVLGSSISTVHVGTFALTPFVFVAVPAPDGATLSGLSVAYYIHQPGSTVNITGNLGALSPAPKRYRISLPDEIVSDARITVYVANESGRVLASAAFSVQDILGTSGQAGLGGGVLLPWLQSMEFLVLLVAVLIGYVCYARDRISGALEPILALPLSRARLPLIRFLSSVTCIALGTAAATGLLVYALEGYLQISTPPVLIVAVWATVFSEGVSMLGIVFLLSRFSRSQGAVMAEGLTLAVIFSLLWDPLTETAAREWGVLPSVYSSPSWQGSLGLLSPTGSVSDPVEWALRWISPHGSQLLATAPSSALALLAIAIWTLLPITATLWLTKIRD